jgi:hypothetical protein
MYNSSALKVRKDAELEGMLQQTSRINARTLKELSIKRETVTPFWWGLWIMFKVSREPSQSGQCQMFKAWVISRASCYLDGLLFQHRGVIPWQDQKFRLPHQRGITQADDASVCFPSCVGAMCFGV